MSAGPRDLHSLSSILLTEVSAMVRESMLSVRVLMLSGASLIDFKSSRRSREMCNAGATMPTTPAVTLRGSHISVKGEEVSRQAGRTQFVSFLFRALSAGSPDNQPQRKAGHCVSCPNCPAAQCSDSDRDHFYHTNRICRYIECCTGLLVGTGNGTMPNAILPL